jgi:hypothetical protein
VDGILRTTTLRDLLHSGHNPVAPAALPSELVSLYGRPKRARSSAISK